MSVYEWGGRIAVRGFSVDRAGRALGSTDLVVVGSDASDEEIGAAVLGVLGRFDRSPVISDDNDQIVRALGVSSRTRLAREGRHVSASALPDGRVQVLPMRFVNRDSSVGDGADSIEVDGLDPSAVGGALRSVLERADPA